MLNEVNTRIKLARSKASFCLMATGGQAFKLKITSAALVVRKVEVASSVYLAHAKHSKAELQNIQSSVSFVKRLRYLPIIWTIAWKSCLAASSIDFGLRGQ